MPQINDVIIHVTDHELERVCTLVTPSEVKLRAPRSAHTMLDGP